MHVYAAAAPRVLVVAMRHDRGVSVGPGQVQLHINGTHGDSEAARAARVRRALEVIGNTRVCDTKECMTNGGHMRVDSASVWMGHVQCPGWPKLGSAGLIAIVCSL